MGALIAPGSDAGAWHVFHPTGAADELRYLRMALGGSTDEILRRGAEEIRRRFRRG